MHDSPKLSKMSFKKEANSQKTEISFVQNLQFLTEVPDSFFQKHHEIVHFLDDLLFTEDHYQSSLSALFDVFVSALFDRANDKEMPNSKDLESKFIYLIF